MLKQIYLRHFAIVDQLTINLKPGLSMITGSTGAGKSLWIDAVQLALGSRAEAHWRQADKSPLEVTVQFDLTGHPHAVQWCQEQALEDCEEECLIRRLIDADGRSRSTINGQPIPLYTLRQLAEQLVIIHSQNQTQKLLQTQEQRIILGQICTTHSFSQRSQYAQQTMVAESIGN